MLIAQKKKSENIAEYILYMYNVEDILRMFHFNIPEMMEKYVKPQLPDISFLKQYESWYDAIAYELQQTGKEKKGHISELQEATMELVYLHQTLLTVVNDEKYKKLSEATAMYLEEFRKKAVMENNHEVEIILHAMNMKLQLKIRGKEISQETEEAFDCMRIQLAYLSREFHRMKSGQWQFSDN